MKKSVENLNEIVLESNDRFDVPKSKTRKAQRSSSSTFASFFGSTSPIRRGFSLFRPKRSRLDSNETFEQLIQRLRLDFKVKAEQLDARKSAAWIPSVERWQSKINRKLEKILLENDLLKKTIEDLDTFVDHQPGENLSTNIESELQAKENQEKPMSTRSRNFNSNEHFSPKIHPNVKRRIFNNSVPTQTPSLFIQTNSFSNENLSPVNKIDSILEELSQCQKIIQQQEQQMINVKKERDQFSVLLDQRTNELCNLKLKNEQFEKVLRNAKENRHDQDHLTSNNNHSNEINQLQQQIFNFKFQYEQLSKENQRLNDEILKHQINSQNERKNIDEPIKSKSKTEIGQTFRFLKVQHENHCQTLKENFQKQIDQLNEEKRRLEKALDEKENQFQQKIDDFRQKNISLENQVQDLQDKLAETKKQLDSVTAEKETTLADMLVAVRVASELQHDAEDRLSKANDDLKRVTEHIESERIHQKRREISISNIPIRPLTGSHGDFGQLKIKDIIRNLEANAQNNTSPSNLRQRPNSQPCVRTESRPSIYQRLRGVNESDKSKSTLLRKSSVSFNANNRSITNEQYEEMKSIIEIVLTRTPGSVCKREALLRWCVERIAKYSLNVTNFSNSWIDGLALCALLHSYLPDRIDFEAMKNENERKRFEVAFQVANSVGIPCILDVNEMCSSEWPDWERVMYYVALIFRHFEVNSKDKSAQSQSPTFKTVSNTFCTTLQTV